LGAQKDLGVTTPECAPRVCGSGQNRRQKVFHWGLRVCAGELDMLKIYIQFTT